MAYDVKREIFLLLSILPLNKYYISFFSGISSSSVKGRVLLLLFSAVFFSLQNVCPPFFWLVEELISLFPLSSFSFFCMGTDTMLEASFHHLSISFPTMGDGVLFPLSLHHNPFWIFVFWGSLGVFGKKPFLAYLLCSTFRGNSLSRAAFSVPCLIPFALLACDLGFSVRTRFTYECRDNLFLRAHGLVWNYA